jgi:hypothetical protein
LAPARNFKGQEAIAILQLLYTGTTPLKWLFLKKKATLGRGGKDR